MVTIDTHSNHSISWVDLAAKDLDGAAEFYSGLFGWTTMNDGVTPYHLFMSGEHPVAGAMGMSPEMGAMPQVWSTYITVADADATIADVTAAGGVVMQPPFDIPNGGRIAVTADPAGAVICLFEGNNDNGMKAVDEVGAPCWFDCLSRDAEAAKAFYEQVFGWTSETMDAGGMAYNVFSHGGQPMCGVMAMPPVMPAEVPSHWVVDFVVADADASAEYVSANGGTVMQPPADTPFGRSCAVLDPWGASLMLIDRSSAD